MNQSFAGGLRRLLASQQFILALLGVIMLAWAQPAWGAVHAASGLDYASFWGVCFVFFMYGLKLSPAQWRSGMRNMRLHILIQTTTFLLFPLLGLAIRPLFPAQQQEIWLAIFFLCALPSTVSSSVVMVSMAKGNVAGAILNAGVSSLAGIVFTPLWMSLFLAQEGEFNTGDIFMKLFYQVVLPVIAGQFLHRWWGKWAAKNARWLKWCDQTVILLIVYSSFCDSFYHHAFRELPGLQFFVLLAGMSALFWVVYFFITLVSRQWHFSREDRVAAQFCGSKKSLIHGTVMSSVLFAGHAHAGLFLLPVMMYHALQLIAAGWLAGREMKNVK